VHFGGTGEVLTLTHETLSASSYEAGILLGLRAALDTTGLVVGLDSLIGLHTPVVASPTADDE
jgi:4-hydroxy-tetrahydrodipicolinate reductase